MKKCFEKLIVIMFCLLSVSVYAAEKDAAGCKDHPLISRIPGYYIAACSNDITNSNMEIINGDATETIHIEGKSIGFIYKSQPDLKEEPNEVKLRNDFEVIIKNQGGSLIGLSYGQKWPIYKIIKNGSEFFVILLIDSGKYFKGSFGCRIIEYGK